MAKEKIRIVVEMHGGTIQSVQTDSGHELDVVFTEAGKYVSEDEEDEEEIEGGTLDGEFIYTHHACTQVSKEDIDPVFAAAAKRLENRE